jgi:hypothetical protein
MGLLHDPRVEALLGRLHAQSSAQDETPMTYFNTRAREGKDEIAGAQVRVVWADVTR